MQIALRVHPGFAAAICIFLILTIFFLLINQNRALKNEKTKLSEMDLQLQKSEALFKTIFYQAPVGIAIGFNDSNIINNNNMWQSINPMFEKIIGRRSEELTDINWVDITHPDDIEKDIELFEKFKAREIDGYSMEKRYIKADGSYTWVHMVIAGLHLGGENTNSHICIIEDINERKIAEEALRESERSKAVLLSHFPGLAYRCNYDKDWTMQFLSDGCLALTGYKPEALLNNKKLSYNEMITPEYRAILWREWERILALDIPFRYEYEITAASGERKWVLELGQGIYNEKNELEALEGIVIDITEHKKKEAQILFLSEHDLMTGLYNRKFFEDEKLRMDRRGDCLPLSIMLTGINGLRLINDAFGYAEGDQVIREVAKILQNCCREGDILARTGGDEFSILMKNTSYNEAYYIQQEINNACDIYNRKINDRSYDISISSGYSTKETIEGSIDQESKAAGDSMYNSKLLNRKSSHSSILSSILATLYARSQETEEHAERIASISNKIGERMQLPQKSLDELKLFSMLHDIGKIGIDDRILNKPGKLSDKEWSVMKNHPEIGYRIAMSSPELESVAEYILSHHERWDGNGYPKGLKGDNIPLLSRILAVADAYDAMTEDRVYRRALSEEAAIEEIRKNSGTQFDPNVVRIFLDGEVSDPQG